jgi:hypothetical protein
VLFPLPPFPQTAIFRLFSIRFIDISYPLPAQAGQAVFSVHHRSIAPYLLDRMLPSQRLWYCGQKRDPEEQIENYGKDKDIHRTKFPPYKPSNDGGGNRDQPAKQAQQSSQSSLLLKR